MRRLPFLFLAIAAPSVAGLLFACGSSPVTEVASTPDAGDGGQSATDAPHGDDDAGDAGADGDAEVLANPDAGDADLAVDASGPPFACGPTLQCYSVTQFCGQVTGPHGGTFFNCNPAPATCATNVSCACLLAQGVVSPCSDVDGGILVVATEP